MPSLLLSYFFILSYSALQAQCASSAPSVTLPHTNVSYVGTTEGQVEHFLSIKFAHDTSGSRRFAPPDPYTATPNSQIDASTPGPACPQLKAGIPPFFAETPAISEDCLHLRIARPVNVGVESGKKNNVPVVVWIHGGGVVKGSACDPHFDPTPLLTLSHELGEEVIYVALNYRLTIFGFARTPLLTSQHSLNVGMRDQRAGLEWVKSNIEHFGGDPERITVYGLSAGGTFASLQLMAWEGKKGVPFSRVWAMSGPPGTALGMDSKKKEGHTGEVARRVGCGRNSEEEVLGCLRQVSMEELLDVAMKYSVENMPPAGLFTFIPSVDGDMFPERQSVLYRSGRFVKGIPMIFGWTQDDGAMNAGPAHLITDEEAIKSGIRNFAPSLHDDDLTKMLELYSEADFQPRLESYIAEKGTSDPDVSVHYFRLSHILRDLLFTCSSIDFASEMNKHSHPLNPNFAGTRIYVLNQTMLTPLFKGAGMPYLGVPHGSDTNYIFNGVFPEGEVEAEDMKLAKKMTEMLIRFAATGDPNVKGLEGDEYWPRASEHNAAVEDVSIQVVGGPLGAGCARIVGDDAGARNEDLHNESVVRPFVKQEASGYRMGEMGSKTSHLRNELLAKEKLVERCAFINSLSARLGN